MGIWDRKRIPFRYISGCSQRELLPGPRSQLVTVTGVLGSSSGDELSGNGKLCFC